MALTVEEREAHVREVGRFVRSPPEGSSGGRNRAWPGLHPSAGLRRVPSVAGAIAVLIITEAWLAATVLVRTVRKSVNRAISTADQLAAGDFSARMGASGPEEFARLGRALDSMAAQLERADTEQPTPGKSVSWPAWPTRSQRLPPRSPASLSPSWTEALHPLPTAAKPPASSRKNRAGLAPGQLERIFDRHYRADEARDRVTGGSGLGLAIARRAAQSIGGRIEVDSKPQSGSVFRLIIPSGEPALARTRKPGSAGQADIRHGTTGEARTREAQPRPGH